MEIEAARTAGPSPRAEDYIAVQQDLRDQAREIRQGEYDAGRRAVFDERPEWEFAGGVLRARVAYAVMPPKGRG